MHTRREFLHTAARGAVPAAVITGAVPLLAQRPVTRGPDASRAAVLGQLTAEMARLHRAARATPPRGEHPRAVAATLRVLAAVDLDADITPGLATLLETRGRDWVLTMPVDMREMTGRLRRLGFPLRPGELAIGQQPWQAREAALDELIGNEAAVSTALRHLADVLDRAGSRLARQGAPGFQPAQFVDLCDDWRHYMIGLEFGLVVLCALGNVPGCIAVAASLAIISWTMYEAGC